MGDRRREGREKQRHRQRQKDKGNFGNWDANKKENSITF